MTSDREKPAQSRKPDRKARLAEALRANLQRRKAQTRSRRTGEPDQRPEGIGLQPDGSGGAEDETA